MLMVAAAATAHAQDASAVRAAEAVAPIAPELPAAVLADLEESRFDAAATALEPLARDGARSADDRAFLGWIRGIALRRAGKLDAAAIALRETMAAAPGSVWTGKLRGELAAVELARKNPAGAERLARAEVEALLSPARKDRLAALVEGFARRLLEPGDPLVPADPGSAYQLFQLAHGIARGDATRGRLLLAMARASRAGGNLQQAASDLEAYLNQHPHASDRAQVSYELAEVQHQSGQHTAARNRWTDLARQLEAPARTDPAARDLRARCLYQIGRSYLDEMRVGADVARLRAGLAVAALRRFLAAEPSHELAVEAAYQVADALERGGQSQPALDAFRAFLDGQGYRAETPQARRRLAELTPPATFQAAAILQAQGKLEEALAAYRRYTERFPGGPQLANAQRAILDVELAIADEHDRRGRHEQARAAREAFVARNPLDPRVPLALFRNGRSLLAEGHVDRAIAAWEALIARFPDDANTARPHWEIARVYEERRADPARAIEHLRRVKADPWMARARERIAVLESRTLAVVTPRTYRSGEVPALKITTRNINSLSFAAYRLDAEDYFRKKHRLDSVESLAIDLVAPEHAWTETIPGAAKYVPVERTVPLKPINAPGAWVVKVGDDATIHAVTLVLVTDVQAIVKASRDQVLVLAQDSATGKGRAGATVLAAGSGEIVLTGRTGPDGVLLANWPNPMPQMARLEYLVLDGPHVAATELTLSDSVAQGLSPRALIYTDRPAYRPGQRARIRGILRDVKDGRFDPGAGVTYRLEVLDSRGRRIVGQAVALSPFGTFHAEVPLDAAAPVGTYRVRVFRPGGSDFGGSFEVQAYRLAKAELSVELPRTVYFRGETVEGHALARYPDGTPMASRPITVTLPDGRTLRGTTDAAGKFPFSLATADFPDVGNLPIVARLTEDEVEATGVAALATLGFSIEPGLARSVYLSGEAFPLRAVTRDATGRPIGQTLSVAVVKQIVERPSSVDQDGGMMPPAPAIARVAEREVARLTLATDPKTGEGSVNVKVEDDEGGSYVLRLSGTDRFGNPVIAERTVTISGSKDPRRLRLLSDRLRFKVGERASINLHVRGGASTALIAWEADRILKYRLVPIKEGDNAIAWDVQGDEFPSVTLTASRMAGETLDESRLDLGYDRDLRITVAPARPVVGPGDQIELEVTTLDQLGRPVAAELSLAMVDRALLARFGDSLPPIRRTFNDLVRTGAFATRATNTFRYAPRAISVRPPGSGGPTRPSIDAPPVAQGRVEGMAPPFDQTAGRRRRPQAVDPSKEARNRAVLAILDEPVDMRFAAETSLDDVLRYIKQATTRGDRPPLQIYVDPLGLQEAERSMSSTVQIDLEGVPLRTSMKLMLEQLGLAYRIEDGVVRIISRESADEALGEAELALERDQNGRGLVIGGMGGMGMMGGMGGGGRGPIPVGPEGGVQGDSSPTRAMPVRNTYSERDAKEKAPASAPADAPARQQMQPAAGKPPASKTAEDRAAFVETAYWNPSVVTDANGRARITFRAPTALAEYRLAALGVTGRETLVGDGTSILSIRKPFHIELKSPAILAEGDEPRLPVRIHHSGIKGPAKVTLEVVADGRTEVFPKDVELADGGVTEILLDAFRVPGADRVRLSVSASATAGPANAPSADRLAVDVPVRAWGLPVFASASGRSSDDATAFVTLPPGRRYENPEMRIALSPRADRMLVELALNDSAVGFTQRPDLGCMPIGTTVERAADLLGAAAALATLRDAPNRDSDAATRLASRVAGNVTELVSAQKTDGSWPWIPVAAAPGEVESGARGDLLATARAVWALTSAEPLGQGADPSVLDRAAKYLEQALAGLDAGEFTLRTEALHALALRGRARFETVNALVRNRQVLSDRTLALLAMTLARQDHAGAAEEVLDVLAARARTEPTGPGRPPLRYWTDGVAPARGLPGSAVETTALAALAFARVRPGSVEASGARAWLLAHRVGNGWIPAEARGLAIQALAASPGEDHNGGGEDRYRLAITVNDTEVFRTEVNGPVEGREIEVPRKLLKTGAENRVAFDIEGRGTFGYAVTLSGVTRDFAAARPPAGRNAAGPRPAAAIRRRAYLAAPPELDGRALETGFDRVVHATPFENRATQVGRGAVIEVQIEADRPATGRGETGGPVVIHEYLPAGTSVVPGSVGSDTAVDWIVSDGLLTVFAPAGPAHVSFHYELRGDVPGRYRVLPTAIQAAEDPGRGDFGAPGELAVLAPGEAKTDIYRPTPDELYDRGKRLFDAGRLADAASPLESLFEGYTLRDDVLRETARMLLYVDLARHDARRIVRDFEIVREKAPELVIAFETLLSVGRAYAEIGEFERAYLGWTALAEASYLEDARIGELLRERGRDLEGIALLLKLWRETPGGPTVDADFLGLAQLIARTAPAAIRDGSNPGINNPDNPSREDRLRQSKRLTETFLASAPGSPLVDEAGLSLAADAYELGDRTGMVRIAERFARVRPNGPLRDRFRYSEALGYFHLGQLDRAIAAARAIVGTDGRAPAPGDSRESAAVRTQALALLGRIHEARLEPAEALTYYRRVAARVVDADDAVEALTARVLRVPEITVIRPGRAGGKGRLALDVTHRNLAELDVRVYPVDLLRLFGGLGNVRANPSADLAGIRPVHQSRLTLERGPGGVDLVSRERRVELPVDGEGAYLVMLRGDDQFASGLAVLTPLELEVTPSIEGGRIRVAVRDAATGRGVPGAQVKILGSRGPSARQGETDLRGVFVAEAVDGRITVVARSGASRYALYRSPAEEDEDRTAAATQATPQPARRGEADDVLRPSARKDVEQRFQRMERRGGMGGMGGGMMGGGFM